MIGEIWKDIQGYEGYYQISNMGRVKSLNYNKTGKERIMKLDKVKGGYLQLYLYKDGKRKHYLVHRLVAQVFLENPDNLPEVNHKDEDKQNNCVDNLEWCSSSYNNSYNDKGKKIGKKLSKPVIGINKVSGLILEFPSAREAERMTGINNSSITKCCKGKRKSTGGYVWYYAD